MNVTSVILSALGVCVIGAIAEGLTAGKNIKPLFARLRFPPYSAPLWAWYLIGALYYAICFTILYRLFRYIGDTSLWNIAFVLILVILATNALWNYIFFRAQSLFGALLLGFPYALSLNQSYSWCERARDRDLTRLTFSHHGLSIELPVRV